MGDSPDRSRDPSPNSVHLLHVMAGCNSTVSLETAKYLLDSGQCSVNDQEPQDLLTPLHVAASWDNLMMCQLFVHYGADLLAMNRDHCSPADIAKGNSQLFLRNMMKRGQKRKNRKVFKFLRHLFQPHKTKKEPQMQRSASTQCISTPQKPTLNQQIDDYLKSPETFNARLSNNRFSGLSIATGQLDAELIKNTQNSNSVYDRTSSLSSYKTASEEPMYSHLQKDPTLPSISVSGNFPLSSALPSLYPTEQMKNLSLNEPDENAIPPRCFKTPTAPPMTPNITIRRPIKLPGNELNNTLTDKDKTPTAIPRSTSLLEAIVPKDIPVTSQTSNSSELTDDEEDPILIDLASKASSLTLEQLKARLNRHHFSPGPLDRTNRSVYEKKLAQLELNAMKGVEYEMRRKKMGFKYSAALERLIKADEIGEELLIGMLEEELIRAEFNDSPNNDDISFFCYLLIDISNLLPNPSFRDFCKAVFYIGKGKRSRPLCHFADTVKHRQNPKAPPSDKIAHILKIWDQGMGVVSLHLFNNIHSAEALIREGSLIDAMTLDSLDNAQRGTFSGAAKSWSPQRKAEYGAFLLYKAYKVYQNERCRPIFEGDVVGAKLW